MKLRYFALIFTIWMTASQLTLASVGCDATFTYSNTAVGQYTFTSNQQRLSGYTYFDTWTVNGNHVSNTASLVYHFSQSSVFNICHTITVQDSLGTALCHDTSCSPVQVILPPTCMPQFYISYSNSGNNNVHFSNSILNYTNLSLRWTFGDGISQTGIASPTHHYNISGNYTVHLFATDTLQHCTDSAITNIYTDSIYHCNLNSGFFINQSLFNTPTISFAVDTTAGTFQSALFDFGDGTSSTLDSGLHTFPAFGVYNVCLTLTDSIHGCISNNCYQIESDTCNRQMVNISATSSGNVMNAYIPYLSNAGYIPTSFVWSFGDNSFDNYDLGTSHVYAHTGSYSVCFTVDMAGCATMDTCVNVNIHCSLPAVISQTAISSLIDQFSIYTANFPNLKIRWTFGDGATGINNYPQHVYAQPGFYNVCAFITDTINGCSDSICTVVYVNYWTDTVCGHVFVDLNLDGIQDSSDMPLAGATVKIIYGNGSYPISATTDSNGFYSVVVPVNSSVQIYLNYSGTTFYTLPFFGNNNNSFANYYYTFNAPNFRQCGFDFGISTNSASVQGRVYADLNADSVLNLNDVQLPGQLITIGNQTVVSMSYGLFDAIVPIGFQNIKLAAANPYNNYACYPAQIPLNVTTAGTHFYNQNLAVQIHPSTLDVAVDLFPTSPISLTNTPSYKLLVSNISAPNAYYAANIVSDSALTFIPYNTGFTSNNPATHTTTWMDNLLPFTQKIYDAYYDLSPSAVMNQDIFNAADVSVMIGVDSNQTNDTDKIHQVVVASFDPNNKTSNQSGYGSQGYIQGNETIDYVIDFQNTGTSYAENIIVKDIISPNLDLKTFRFLASSRDCDIRLTGDTVYFRFSHIDLSFGGDQDTGSKAWLAYSIKPMPNLPQFTQITNTAGIYFDHNQPVYTNTTLHTINGSASISSIYTDGGLTINPNPFRERTLVTLTGTLGKQYTYGIYDILGRQIQQGELMANTSMNFERAGLNSGTYFISFYDSGNLVQRAKMIAY